MTPALFSHRKHWAARFGTAPFLPMSRAEMTALGWDACDIILVTGDAYIDHPSFGMALVGRLLEAQAIASASLRSRLAVSRCVCTLGQPTLYFGVTAGNMDSMVNRYTSDAKPVRRCLHATWRAQQAPRRAVTVYAQRCREAFPGTPVIIGSIEASCAASRITTTGRTRAPLGLPDSKADLLISATPSAPCWKSPSAWPRARKSPTSAMCAAPVSWWARVETGRQLAGSSVHRARHPGAIDAHVDPYAMTPTVRPRKRRKARFNSSSASTDYPRQNGRRPQDVRERTVIRLPDSTR